MRRKITEVIEDWHRNDLRKALLIRGSKKVGKTHSVREFGDRVYKGHFLEINFKTDGVSRGAFGEDLTVDTIIRNLSAIHRHFEFIPGRTLLFFDEIQYCPAARSSLKQLAEDGRYRIIASGSLLGIKMKEVGLHPMGYLRRAMMHPMDFEEFLWALGMPQQAIDDVKGSIALRQPIDGFLFDTFSRTYCEYLAVGGMPEAVYAYARTGMTTQARRVHDELFEGYLDDISNYAPDSIKTLAKACLDAIPSMLASENKRFVFADVGADDGAREDDRGRREGTLSEGSKATGFRYFSPALDWLSMAGATLTCNRVSEPKSPLEERMSPGMFKLYMLDTGALLSRYDDSVFSGLFVGGDLDVNAGAIAENAVAQAFAAQGRRLMYVRKDDTRYEADFVTVVGGQVCCVKVKPGGNRRCKSLNNLMGDYGTRGIMFETRNVFTDDKGVDHYPLFAASFMDAIDPRPATVADHSAIDRLREMYGGRGD